MKALFFNPHNDDTIISLGGTLIGLIEKGWEIGYIYMTDGRHGSNIMTPEKTFEVRSKEAKSERKFLGIRKFWDMGIEDGTLSKISQDKKEKVMLKISKVLDDYKPEVVFIPTRSEMHPDHRATHDLAWEILEKRADHILVAKYLIWFFPDFYAKRTDVCEKIMLSGIDKHLDKKIEAIRLHKSQIAEGHYDIISRHINAYFAQIFKTYQEKGPDFVEVIGLFNRSGQNRKAEEALISGLEEVKDISRVFHGRSEERIEA
jgi:LmbE family N-acetylglucosaminyl deacetylase